MIKQLNVLTTLQAGELESQQDYMTSITKLSYAVEEVDKLTEGEDGRTNDSCSMQCTCIEKSANAAETGILGSYERRKRRANTLDVPSTDSDSSKKQKTLIAETLNCVSPAHGLDTKEISELQVDYNKNM